MNYELRKSDSLAYATGSFKQNLGEINLRWNEHIVKLGDLGPQIIGGINESIKGSKNEEIAIVVKSSLSEFLQILTRMDETNAEMVDLMIDMEGLDFPEEKWNELFFINTDEWKEELTAQKNFLDKIGRRLPKELIKEYRAFKERLEKYK